MLSIFIAQVGPNGITMDFPGGAECLKSATLPRGLLLISSAVGQLTLTWEARWPRLIRLMWFV